MGDIHLELEEIIGEDEFLEHRNESEPQLDDIYTMDFENQYDIHSERLEIEDAIEKCHELPPEKIGDHYFLDSHLVEVQEAIDQIHEIPENHEDRIRYLEPDE